MHPVDAGGRPGDQDGNGKDEGGAQVGELDGVEAVELGPEFAEGTPDGGEEVVVVEAGLVVVVGVGARGGVHVRGGVGGAVVGGVGVAVAGTTVVVGAVLGGGVGGFLEAGFGTTPVGGGPVGCVVDVDVAEGRGAGAGAGVDGGWRDDVVFAGRGRRGAVGGPRVDAVVSARGVGGKGDLGDGRGRRGRAGHRLDVGVVGDVDFDLGGDGAVGSWMVGEILCACGKESVSKG